MATAPDDHDDPLTFDEIERAIRANEVRHLPPEAQHFFDDDYDPDDDDDDDDDDLYDDPDRQPEFRRLIEAGLVIPPPEALDDEALTAKLWELIRALADRHVYLDHTDHLSDRELYTELVEEVLWDDLSSNPCPGLYKAGSNCWTCDVDLLGSGSEDDLMLMLTYYLRDEDERQSWTEDTELDEIPAWRPPPYDRDRHLPEPVELEPVFEDEYLNYRDARESTDPDDGDGDGESQFRDEDIPF